MAKDESSLVYYPPPINLFRERGRGLLWHASICEDAAWSALASADEWADAVRNYLLGNDSALKTKLLKKFGDHMSVWREAIRPAIRKHVVVTDSLGPTFIPKLFELVYWWARASDFVARVVSMTPEDKGDHVRLNPEINLDELHQKNTELTIRIERLFLDSDVRDFMLDEFIRQFEEALVAWDSMLKWAEEKPGVRPYDDPDEVQSIAEFATHRDNLEYALVGFYNVRHANIRKPEDQQADFPVKELTSRRRRLMAMDDRFRAALAGRRDLRFYEDKAFWWHHPENERNNG